jgi:trehalose/maltose hydrolase-like predicted phosphorylase
LDIQNAVLNRSFTTKINNKTIIVNTKRILSLHDRDIALIEYSIKAIDACHLLLNAYLDANVGNYMDGMRIAKQPKMF